jgi:hypothetical protein
LDVLFMKKYLFVFVCMLLVLMFAGCSRKSFFSDSSCTDTSPSDADASATCSIPLDK